MPLVTCKPTWHSLLLSPPTSCLQLVCVNAAPTGSTPGQFLLARCWVDRRRLSGYTGEQVGVAHLLVFRAKGDGDASVEHQPLYVQ